MNPRPTTPAPSQDPGEQVARAAALCGERGAQLTALRRQILALLWRHGAPMGAYELIDVLKSETGRPVGPPTIYRALEFLRTQGLVTRIESRNAYVPCAHPERPHLCLLFLCARCGASTELENPEIERALAAEAAGLGFRSTRCVVEVEGLCAACAGAA